MWTNKNSYEKLSFFLVWGFLACFVIFYLVIILTGCSELKEAGLLDSETCYLCHSVPPDRTIEHNFSYPGYDVKCRICHVGYNEENLTINKKYHYNGRNDVVFDLAFFDSVFFKGHMEDFDEITYEKNTCYNIPCHGFGREGRYNTTFNDDSTFIAWDDSASFTVWRPWASVEEELDCNGCHNTTDHKAGRDCENCHEVVTRDGVSISNYALHINGVLEKDKRN
jgi:hypothetical protein